MPSYRYDLRINRMSVCSPCSCARLHKPSYVRVVTYTCHNCPTLSRCVADQTSSVRRGLESMPPKKKAKQVPKTMDTGDLLQSGVTKTGLKKIIDSLHRTGHLNVKLSRNEIKRRVAHHSTVDTPHGKVLQSMDVGGQKIEFLHPAALLFYLCTISEAFRSAMLSAKAEASNGRCHFVLYSDAATPGNVFRPDKGRKYEAFYWCALFV